MRKRKIIVAITGASGAIYTKLLLSSLQKIHEQIEDVGLVFSKSGREVWKYEMSDSFDFPYMIYPPDNFFTPFASGSAQYDTMIVCPCTMGTMGRIANGIADDLITRAADVILKERRKLLLVVREMPYNLIHLNNMRTITQAGGIICPASPTFYGKPKTIDKLAQTVVDRVLDLAGFEILTQRWQED